MSERTMDKEKIIKVLEVAQANALFVYKHHQKQRSSQTILKVLLADLKDAGDLLNGVRDEL